MGRSPAQRPDARGGHHRRTAATAPAAAAAAAAAATAPAAAAAAAAVLAMERVGADVADRGLQRIGLLRVALRPGRRGRGALPPAPKPLFGPMRRPWTKRWSKVCCKRIGDPARIEVVLDSSSPSRAGAARPSACGGALEPGLVGAARPAVALALVAAGGRSAGRLLLLLRGPRSSRALGAAALAAARRAPVALRLPLARRRIARTSASSRSTQTPRLRPCGSTTVP